MSDAASDRLRVAAGRMGVPLGRDDAAWLVELLRALVAEPQNLTAIRDEAEGVDREDALMHAGRVRLRPILMTPFALIAGMMPVAIGLGEGGEYCVATEACFWK